MDVNTTAGVVEVDGTPIAYDVTGAPGAPSVALVHGFAAHRHWWDDVLPRLAPTLRVLRIDLSGHGDSGHRSAYAIATWAEELVAVQTAVDLDPGLVVGHSFGGRVAIESTRVPGTRTTAVLTLDTSFRLPQEHRRSAAWPRPRRVYPSREAAIERFRLVPPQPLDPDALARLGAHSVHAIEEGWEWKHDHQLRPEEVGATRFTGIDVPFDIAYGELSAIVDIETTTAAAALDPSTTVTVIPGAHHHLVLDSPDAAADIIIATAQRHAGLHARRTAC